MKKRLYFDALCTSIIIDERVDNFSHQKSVELLVKLHTPRSNLIYVIIKQNTITIHLFSLNNISEPTFCLRLNTLL